jgi:D-alanyl-D-alanine carboxypeptidase/D-alanyl-D-alanine-endopeptidase (penicillin-binding protein 4)
MRIRWTTFSALCTLAVASMAVAGSHDAPALQEAIRSLVKRSSVPQRCVAVSVRDARTGEVLVDIDADRKMIPASNMKLFTSGAAILGLGHDYRFTTTLRLHDNNLTIVGDGDPAFGDPTLMAMDPRIKNLDGLLDLWVDGVAKADQRHIDTIIVDDRIFDRICRDPSWPKDQLDTWYCCEVAGVNVHLNIFYITASPPSGTTATVTVSPSNAPGTLSNVTTSQTGSARRDTFSISTSIANNNLRALGNVTTEREKPLMVAMNDPPRLLGDLLAARLRARGIDVGAVRLASEGDLVAPGIAVGPRIVTPMTTVVTRCNEDSYNLYAEALLKRLGARATNAPGSFKNGASAVHAIITERLGDASEVLTITDGSGMSRHNRVTADLLTQWLTSFTPLTPTGQVFIESLSIPGETGTLKKRFHTTALHGATVRAKSGYLTGVSTLSGYIFADPDDPHTPRWVFSILTNDLPDRAQPAKELQEEIVSALAAQLQLEPSPIR